FGCRLGENLTVFSCTQNKANEQSHSRLGEFAVFSSAQGPGTSQVLGSRRLPAAATPHGFSSRVTLSSPVSPAQSNGDDETTARPARSAASQKRRRVMLFLACGFRP